jgi:hypothetical protein
MTVQPLATHSFEPEKPVSLQNFAGNAGFSVRDTPFCS